MLFKSVIRDVLLAIYILTGVRAEFSIDNNERFSRVRYLVSHNNPLSIHQNKPFFQWEAEFPTISDVTRTTTTIKTPKSDDESKSKSVVKKRRKKRRRKPRQPITSTTCQPLELPETVNTTVSGEPVKPPPRRRKQRRRRKFRKNRKQRPHTEKNSILEITTAKTVNNTNNNLTLSLDELIKRLNENPEVKFNNLNGNILLHNKDNLTKITNTENSNKFFNLKVDLGVEKAKKSKHKRLKSRCKYDNGGCSQICRHKGPNKCGCLKGYVLDEDMRSCKDVNECETNNGGCQSLCDNKMGAHECRCTEGFRLGDDGRSCVDINECLLRNGHGPCDHICHNTHGSYSCSCRNGTNLSNDKHTCLDVDECANGTAGCSHTCINTLQGAFCACPDGLELSMDWKTCRDINECDRPEIKKSCSSSCINTEGSYKCLNVEYQNDQALGTPICKPLFPPKTPGYLKCSREGAVQVFTLKGRRLIINSPGTTCNLICPIGYKLTGEYHLTCGFHGSWEGKSHGLCKKALAPIIQCPSDQYFKLKKGAKSTIVRFPTPNTNVHWNNIKSSPKWAKRLIGKLNEGTHLVHFKAVDPNTKLQNRCYFKIHIVKAKNN